MRVYSSLRPLSLDGTPLEDTRSYYTANFSLNYITLLSESDYSLVWLYLLIMLAVGLVGCVGGIGIYFVCRLSGKNDVDQEDFEEEENAEKRLLEYNMEEARKEKASGREIEMSLISGSKSRSDKSRGKGRGRAGEVKIGNRTISLLDRDPNDPLNEAELPTRQYRGEDDLDYMKPKPRQTPAFVKPEAKATSSRL